VLAALEHARGGVEQIDDLLVVDLHLTGLDVDAVLPLGDQPEDLVERPGHDPTQLAQKFTLAVQDGLLALHGVGLAAAGLALGEDRG